MNIALINQMREFKTNNVVSILDKEQYEIKNCDEVLLREDGSKIAAINEDGWIFHEEGFYEINPDGKIGRLVANYSW